METIRIVLKEEKVVDFGGNPTPIEEYKTVNIVLPQDAVKELEVGQNLEVTLIGVLDALMIRDSQNEDDRYSNQSDITIKVQEVILKEPGQSEFEKLADEEEDD